MLFVYIMYFPSVIIIIDEFSCICKIPNSNKNTVFYNVLNECVQIKRTFCTKYWVFVYYGPTLKLCTKCCQNNKLNKKKYLKLNNDTIEKIP